MFNLAIKHNFKKFSFMLMNKNNKAGSLARS